MNTKVNKSFNYWVKCPLDIKDKIQQHLKYNMQKELHRFWYGINKELYGKCDSCNTVISYYEKHIQINSHNRFRKDMPDFTIEMSTNVCFACINKRSNCKKCNMDILFRYLTSEGLCYNCTKQDDYEDESLDVICDDCNNICIHYGEYEGDIYCYDCLYC